MDISPLPPGRPLPRPDAVLGTKASPPHRDPLKDPLEQLADALKVRHSGDREFLVPGMVERLQKALNGSTLDLGDYDVVCDLEGVPPEAWDALQRLAQQAGHKGISQVKVGKWCAVDHALVEGLKRLPTLEHVDVEMATSRNRDIDFGDLRRACPKLESIDILGDVFRALKITVPPKVKVTSKNTTQPALEKSFVHYRVEAEEKEEPPSVLHGVIYRNQAKDFGWKADAASNEEAQQRALDVQLNGAATAPMHDPRLGKDVERKVLCRHIAMMWLRHRFLHPDDFSYDPFKTVEALRGNMPPDAEVDYERMLAQGACGIFEGSDFGATLADELALLAPGQKRHLALTAPNHVIGIEIGVKERVDGGRVVRDYVVDFYEPNATATHHRLVVSDLAELRTKKLEDWVGNEMAEDFIPGQPAICNLYRWPAPQSAQDESPVGPSTHVSPASRASGGFLAAALEGGTVSQVREAFGSLVAHSSALGLNLEQELRAAYKGIPALHGPILWGRADSVRTYVNELLAIPDELLGRQAKIRLLAGKSDHGTTAMRLALRERMPDAMAAYVGAILDAPDAWLSEGEKAELLDALSPSGFPVLRSLSLDAPPSPVPPATLVMHKNVRAHVTLLAKSTLPDERKDGLVASLCPDSEDRTPAARLALDEKNPGVAAAMFLGLLDAGLGVADMSRLLTKLGVSKKQIVAALSIPYDDAADAKWARELIEEIERRAAEHELAVRIATALIF